MHKLSKTKKKSSSFKNIGESNEMKSTHFTHHLTFILTLSLDYKRRKSQRLPKGGVTFIETKEQKNKTDKRIKNLYIKSKTKPKKWTSIDALKRKKKLEREKLLKKGRKKSCQSTSLFHIKKQKKSRYF